MQFQNFDIFVVVEDHNVYIFQIMGFQIIVKLYINEMYHEIVVIYYYLFNASYSSYSMHFDARLSTVRK